MFYHLFPRVPLAKSQAPGKGDTGRAEMEKLRPTDIIAKNKTSLDITSLRTNPLMI